jgi:hypothetical protein
MIVYACILLVLLVLLSSGLTIISARRNKLLSKKRCITLPVSVQKAGHKTHANPRKTI